MIFVGVLWVKIDDGLPKVNRREPKTIDITALRIAVRDVLL